MRAVNINERLADRLALTTNEVVAVTGVGRNTVYQAIASGELKARKIGQRKFVIPVDEVKRWLNKDNK